MKVKLSRIQLLYIGFGDHYIGSDGKLYFKDARDIPYALIIKKVLQQADKEKLFPETGMAIAKSTDSYVFRYAVSETPSIILIDYVTDTTLVALTIYPKSRLTEADLMAGLKYFSAFKREGNKYFTAEGAYYAELKPLSTGKEERNQEGNDTGNPEQGSQHGLGLFNISIDFLNKMSDALLNALGLDPQTYRKWVYLIAAGFTGYHTLKADTSGKQALWGGSTALLAYLALSDPKEDNNTEGGHTEGCTSFIGRKDLSKGLRNNNPLNIHLSKRAYKGKVMNPVNPDFDSDGKQLERFETFEYGLKAAKEHLLRYFDGNIEELKCFSVSKGKLNTIQKILNRWVCGLNPAAYIQFVERETGFDKNTVLNLADAQTLTRLMYAMTLQECGAKYRETLLNATDFQRFMKGALAL